MTPHEELKKMFIDRNPMAVSAEISGFTGFKKTKIDELSEAEAINLLAIHCPAPKTLQEEYNALKEDVLRREYKAAILATAEKEGIKDPGSDFKKFNNWMLKSSVYKKHLNAHSLKELEILLIQIKTLQFNNGKSAQKPLNEAWMRKASKYKNLN
ncbi:hypothetical protein [Elizabethkingia phage TCUEAP3]|nr:hypothetical protein [Elizabethkingia phage TCUEAP3]